ncbi:tRNA (adenosine(37)-N6)-threonylcarbamoyltransferase complex ATPase subunit type 1 TsaE [candidate division TM6 bacterium RIFCSPHIGHO2_12_FULL_38_8]|nr:MAG: tRNA (adenosine(37)-N6)-threonylcarbamoyltransferase complex ATPase subunit type 1 TsaE [candidate division TM6 bacterium RIFCSPHIGHO2_12_FULL_38_8]
MKTIEYDLSEINAVACKLLAEIKNHRIVGLIGPLGAGKTTWTQAMLRALGVCGPVISPTFTYLNQYQAADGRAIYHFDLYRLQNIAEFAQLGFFEYLEQSNSLIFIEWPEILLPNIQQKILLLNIASIDDKKRKISYEL